MAETLGSLCDKLAIVKMKQLHVSDEAKKRSLDLQERQLDEEISEYLAMAVSGAIPPEKLTFAANKIYKKEGNETHEVSGTIGEIFSRLVEITAELWNVQERIYDFENVPAGEKDEVVKKQRVLNLERTQCMDEINNILKKAVGNKK